MVEFLRDLGNAVELVSRIGAIGLLSLFIYGAFKPGKKWWYSAEAYEEMKDDRNQYRDLLFRAVGVNDRAVGVLHRVVEKQDATDRGDGNGV